MANPEGGKGAVYQYYWIKVSTKQQMDEQRKQMLQRGNQGSSRGGQGTDTGINPGDPRNRVAGEANPDTGINPGPLKTLLGGTPDTGINPGDPRYRLIAGVAIPDTGINPGPLKQGGASGDTATKHSPIAGLNAEMMLAFIQTPEHMNEKGMMLECRPMLPGRTLKEVNDWIASDEGKQWVGDSFRILAYVALTE
jgi:hypothetical protein